MAAMGLLQLAGWPVFLEAVEGYRVPGGRPVAIGLAAGLIAGELAAAVALFRDQRIGAVLSLAVMVVWTVMAVQAFSQGLVLDNCGCFGRLWRQELRWWVLLEDAYLLGASWWALRRYRAVEPAEAEPIPVSA
jgi:hypothetical protein